MAKQISSANDATTEPPDLKRKLVWRMGFAGLMIVMLLASLALFDYLSAPDELESSAPSFTAPVPVPKKEITQPVKQAEPIPEVPPVEVKPPAPEVSSAPAEAPARPEVASQPALPRAAHPAEPRSMPLSRPPASVPQQQSPAAASPAPSRSAEVRPPADTSDAAEASPVRRQPVAPAGGSTLGGRLFSGFALQAGVFSDPRLAEELHAKLTLNGIPSTLEARVQVGPFKTRDEADAAREKMKALGIDAVLLMPPKGAMRR